MSHHDINTGTAKPASERKPCSRETTSPLRRYISASPRCTVTDSSYIAQRTNSPLGMRPLSAAMSPRRFTNLAAPLRMYRHVSTANGTNQKVA